MIKELGVFDCIGDGWERYKVYLGLATGFYLLYLVIALVGAFIPFINIIFGLLIAPALAGGAYLFYLHVARGDNPRIDDMFEGFRRYAPLIGLEFLAMFVVVVGMIPGILIMVVLGTQSTQAFAVGIGVAVVNFFVLIWILMRYVLVYFIIMDYPSIGLFDALQQSVFLTRGNTHNLFLLGLVSAVICVAAAILLIIPLLFAVPAMHTAFAVAYLKLKQDRMQEMAPPPEQPGSFGSYQTPA